MDAICRAEDVRVVVVRDVNAVEVALAGPLVALQRLEAIRLNRSSIR